MRTDRREFLRDGLRAMSTLRRRARPARRREGGAARSLPPGVHLFLDSEFIAEERNMRGVIRPPTCLPEPVVTAVEDRCFQPYVSVLRDPADEAVPHAAHTRASARPAPAHRLPAIGGRHPLPPPALRARGPELRLAGAYVVDDGPDAADPGRRYKLAWENGGLFTATSPDGLKWTASSRRPASGDIGDIIALSRDPIRGDLLDLQGALDPRGRLQGEHAEREGGIAAWSARA